MTTRTRKDKMPCCKKSPAVENAEKFNGRVPPPGG